MLSLGTKHIRARSSTTALRIPPLSPDRRSTSGEGEGRAALHHLHHGAAIRGYATWLGDPEERCLKARRLT